MVRRGAVAAVTWLGRIVAWLLASFLVFGIAKASGVRDLGLVAVGYILGATGLHLIGRERR